VSEIFNEANDAPARTTSKQGQLMWTFRQLNGMGPGGNQFYIFRYASKGKRVVKWFKTEREAKAEMKTLNAELSEAGNGAVLDYRTRLDAYRASAMLEPFGVSLVEAAEAFIAARRREENPVMISTIVEAVRNEYRLKLANKEVRETTVESLNKSLRGLVEAFGNVNIKTLDGAEIKSYIAGHEAWAPKTKVGKFTDWSTAFKVAVQLRLIERNPLDGISNFRVKDRQSIEIIPVDKVRDLIANAPDRVRAGLVLKLFTGMRTSEVCRLDWSAINLDRGSVLVDAAISKTRRTRRFNLDGLLSGVAEWLRPLAGEGKVYSLDESTFNKDIAKSEEAIGYSLDDNAARHTFCSYHFIAGKSESETTRISGHSIKMFHSNYEHDVCPTAAAAFFALRPVT
jgi:integrase